MGGFTLRKCVEGSDPTLQGICGDSHEPACTVDESCRRASPSFSSQIVECVALVADMCTVHRCNKRVIIAGGVCCKAVKEPNKLSSMFIEIRKKEKDNNTTATNDSLIGERWMAMIAPPRRNYKKKRIYLSRQLKSISRFKTM